MLVLPQARANSCASMVSVCRKDLPVFDLAELLLRVVTIRSLSEAAPPADLILLMVNGSQCSLPAQVGFPDLIVIKKRFRLIFQHH